MIPYQLLRQEAANHPYPLLFATISGAHLYGFPSPDSDFDLRGAHILPLREIASLDEKRETVQTQAMRDALELDLVTHDIRKFIEMLLKNNGYVLEQLYSPLVVLTTPEHAELLELARGCVTRHHVYHYLGFANTQWNLFLKENPPRVKPLLYVYRVLLTGIHLMRTGQVEANLVTLNEEFALPYIADLVRRKVEGTEQGVLPESEHQFHHGEFQRLQALLREAHDNSALPERPTSRAALNDLLIRVRLATGLELNR
jgi:predicted nucleotidyltransferase